jgi:hypothetical protein
MLKIKLKMIDALKNVLLGIMQNVTKAAKVII